MGLSHGEKATGYGKETQPLKPFTRGGPLTVLQNRLERLPSMCETLQAWRQPREHERPVKMMLAGWVEFAQIHSDINSDEQWGRYFKAQALALRALVDSDRNLGRFSRNWLRNTVVECGTETGINWEELDGYDTDNADDEAAE